MSSTTEIQSRRWVLAQRADNDIDLSKTFRLETTTLPSTHTQKYLLRHKYFSNEPSQRTWISSAIPQDRHYMKLVDINEPMTSATVSEVISVPTEGSKYQKGDMVFCYGNWNEYSLLDEKEILGKVTIDPSDFIALGGTALTAYFGLYRIAKPTKDDKTIVISGAAGSTGSVVVQIAKHVLGIENVVGIAGSDDKCTLLKEIGCDVALNYKSTTFKEEFEQATQGYIDIYWDNVGGSILDMCVNRMARGGRIVACGAVSGYDNRGGSAVSMDSWMKVVSMRVRIEGFIVLDFKEEWGTAKEELGKWVMEGKLKALKTVWETGFESVPEGMLKLLSGENVGKLVTKIA